MKKLNLYSALFLVLLQSNVNAKTICTMTFNSKEEKEVFSRNLTPVGYQQIELVPENKDPTWFTRACATVKSCDILLVSGHFGGIFFGDKAATISLNELIEAREKSLCPAILDKPKAVYLMGCNTLASKSADHRSVSDYLRVLVGDGFPLRMAEDVAASRYLNFGQSMASFMNTIFNKSEMIVGFESTGPLGIHAAPLLEKAFKASSETDKNRTGISKDALLRAFKDTNLKIVTPTVRTEDQIKTAVLNGTDQISYNAWKSVLAAKNISVNYDFIIKYKTHPQLARVLAENPEVASLVKEKMTAILKQASGLSAIQIRVLDFLQYHQLINYYSFEESLKTISNNIISQSLDYVAADQLCSLFKDHQDINLISHLSDQSKHKINISIYGDYLNKCNGTPKAKPLPSRAHKCLTNHEDYDWSCLINNPKDLDVEACVMAKENNSDPENADDMLWFCYDKMLANHYLNRATCLELTHNFSILGNQIKSNWNCLNKI